MKIEIFDTGLFIELNKLREVTSPVLFQRGDIPDPNGLISNDIFGISVRSRKETFAYINLNGYFFHPHVYKAFKRLWRNVERVVNGSEYYSIDKDGRLVKDENGETGIDFLYNNWERIKWERSLDASSIRNERIDILTKSKKNEVFTKYQIVIPAFYRDIMENKKGGGNTDKLNPLYSKLIRMASLLKERNMFDFTLHSTIYNIQNLMVDIYDYFKDKLDGKGGLIRKYLMGKNVDYCTRTVITAPNFHYNRPEDMEVGMRYAGVQLPHALALTFPYVVQWLRNFFDNNMTEYKTGIPTYDVNTGEVTGLVKLKNPESYFNDKYIETMVNRYIKDPEYRFNPIEVPVEGPNKRYMIFTGKVLSPQNEELTSISNRYLTVTDLLYVCASEICKDKHILVTRYPLLDSYGIFVARIHVTSTLKTEVVKLNSVIYKHYPHIELDCPPNKIGTRFIDSLQFSNSYLPGLDGDYDGDQTTSKIIWSQEANDECEKLMNKVSYFITPTGMNKRYIELEAIQTFFTMTKNPTDSDRMLSRETVEKFLALKSTDLTFEKLVDLFGTKLTGKTTIAKPKYNCTDKMVLEPHDYFNNGKTETTLGRFIFNKILVEFCELQQFTGYVNYVLDDDGFGKFQSIVSKACSNEKIPIDTMYKYTDTRDWLGLQLHSVITTSFTPGVTKIPKEVQKLKDDLIKKYKKELDNGDYKVAENIEKELIAKTKEVLKDDIGMDLYVSGARGSIGNNMKNMLLMRGAVKNSVTGKYDISTAALNDGMDKRDIPLASNTIVEGAYPKTVRTADSGYLAKQLLSCMQAESIDDYTPDCGTNKTLNFVLKSPHGYVGRNIMDHGKLVMLTDDNIKSYVGKEIHLRSPMYCHHDKICRACAGNYKNTFIGLDSSKISTTLTRLNMKKFHDNVIKTNHISPNLLLLNNKKQIFGETKDNIVLTDNYCEFYIPKFYFSDSYRFSEDRGTQINSIGIFNVGIFNNNKLAYIDTLNLPVWTNFNRYETDERVIDLPGSPATPCLVLKYFKGNALFENTIIIDSLNAESFLHLILKGKLPTSIPYSKAMSIWQYNMDLSDVNFGVPPLILELVLSVCYRYKKDVLKKFSKIIGNPALNKGVSEYDYLMASYRQICQFTSTFSAITFEDIDTMITASINRGRDNKAEKNSPIEILFKL